MCPLWWAFLSMIAIITASTPFSSSLSTNHRSSFATTSSSPSPISVANTVLPTEDDEKLEIEDSEVDRGFNSEGLLAFLIDRQHYLDQYTPDDRCLLMVRFGSATAILSLHKKSLLSRLSVSSSLSVSLSSSPFCIHTPRALVFLIASQPVASALTRLIFSENERQREKAGVSLSAPRLSLSLSDKIHSSSLSLDLSAMPSRRRDRDTGVDRERKIQRQRGTERETERESMTETWSALILDLDCLSSRNSFDTKGGNAYEVEVSGLFSLCRATSIGRDSLSVKSIFRERQTHRAKQFAEEMKENDEKGNMDRGTR